MEVRYLLAFIALVLAVWLVSAQIRSSFRNRSIRQSRRNLRERAADRTLAGRLFGGSRAKNQRRQPTQQSSVAETISEEVDNTAAVEADITSDSTLVEMGMLRSQLQEKDQTILQLQQVLDELTSTTATRESVNFLQKQLIASRAKVLQQEGELKQLKVAMGKRRLPTATVSGNASDEAAPQLPTDQNTQTNEAMKAKLGDQLKHAEAEAEDNQQNALELRRLRSELESVREDRSNARAQIEALQTRVSDQQQMLEQGAVPPASVDRQQGIKPLYATLEDRDDLKLIKGIGPVLERKLNALGVTTFRQLASFTERDIDRVATAISAFPGRIQRDDWVGKARELLAQTKNPA